MILARRKITILRRWSSNTPLDKSGKSYAFSGCGWLVPFFFGVIDELRSSNQICKDSFVSGTSGGSIAALVVAADIDTKHALELFIKIAKNNSEVRNMDNVLKTELSTLLLEHFSSTVIDSNNRLKKEMQAADNINAGHLFIERINEKRNLNICVTQIKPFTLQALRNPIIINRYRSLQGVVETVAASSFIPIYSHLGIHGSQIMEHGVTRHSIVSVLKSIRTAMRIIVTNKSLFYRLHVAGTYCDRTDIITSVSKPMITADGGIGSIMPPVGEITIAPFSAAIAPFLYSKPRRPVIAIGYPSSPNDNDSALLCSLGRLFLWAAKPPTEDIFRELFAEGVRATRCYLDANK